MINASFLNDKAIPALVLNEAALNLLMLCRDSKDGAELAAAVQAAIDLMNKGLRATAKKLSEQ